MTNKAFYLLFSSAIILIALGFTHVQDLQRDLDQELLEQMDELLRLLEESENESRELREENQELERLHHVRLEQRTLLASRGGRPSIPILSPSGTSAEHFERAFEALGKPGMAGLGQALVDAEAETGVSALVLAGICALESAWGESKLARERNNLAGLGAYDGQEDRFGLSFASREVCVTTLAYLIADGGTLDDVGRWYASDPGWAQKVAGCMRVIVEAGR